MTDLFSYFLSRKTDTKDITLLRKGYAYWFVTAFPNSEFQGEDAIFYDMVEYANKVGVLLTEKVISIYFARSLKTLLVKKNIHVAGTETLMYTDPNQIEEAYIVTSDIINKEYIRLLTITNDVEEFKVDADVWMQEKLNERLVQMYTDGFSIISSYKNKMMGTDDALNFTLQKVALIQEIYDPDKIEELNSQSSSTAEDKDKMRFISDTGIATIDADCHGIFGTQLFGIEAPPGVGKTKFAVGTWAYRAAVIHKQNVLYIALEQSKWEIECNLVARHIFQLFQKQINAGDIIYNNLSRDNAEVVEIARQDLFDSGKYGKIVIEAEKPLYIDTFTEQLKSWDNLKGPFDMVIIDYMTLIEQKEGSYAKSLKDFEIAKRSYRKFKRYLRDTGKCGVAVNQLNVEGIRAGEADKKTGTTGAAGGMETYRSCDYNLVLTVTEQMEAQMKRRISQPKKRATAGFGTVIVDVRMGINLFYQSNETL